MTRRIKRHRIREIMTPSPITVGPKTGILYAGFSRGSALSR
jgi:hypothetical protein